MEIKEQKRLGRVLGAVGLLILALNLMDFMAGLNKIADETALLGIALALAGAYLALKK